MPSASSSLSRSESRRSERSGTSSRTSEKRSGPSISTNRIAPVQRLPISSTARWYWRAAGSRGSAAAVPGPPPLTVAGRHGRRMLVALGPCLRRPGAAAPPRPSRRGHVARPGDQVAEAGQRDVRDGLEDLLVGPARLARLLVEVPRRARPRSRAARARSAAARPRCSSRESNSRASAISSSPRPGLARGALRAWPARTRCPGARRPRARSAAGWPSGSAPWRSSERKRA